MIAPFSLSALEIDILRAALSHPTSAEEPGLLLGALDGIAQRAVGHRLFTALRYDLAAGTAHRLYSSAPDRYPASGTKLISAAPAMQKMLATGKPLLTPDADAVRISFPDADAIFALNCQSVLNIPVYGRGRLLGQINLLHAANHYTPAHTDFCAGLAVIAATAFL